MPCGTGEGNNLQKFRLLPFGEWEKVADRPDEGLFAESQLPKDFEKGQT
jgi:hypothetical protein